MTTQDKIQKIRDKIDEALIAQGLDGTRVLKMFGKIEYQGSVYFIHKEEYFGFIGVGDGSFVPVKDIKILGRDITFEDCVLAVLQFDEKTPLEEAYKPIGMLALMWKPTIPLHLQSTQTIDFLYKLIVKEDERL